MTDDLTGVIMPPPDDESGPGEVVLQFPVEIEVRMVAPYDDEQVASAALDQLTAELQGLA